MGLSSVGRFGGVGILALLIIACGSGPSEDVGADANTGVTPPVFSIPSSAFTGTLQLELSTETTSALIVYTDDGSLPTAADGIPYDGPIAIETTSEIRAATIAPERAPAIASESYVRLSDDVVGYSSALPIVIVENLGGGPVPDKGWTTSTQTGAGLVQLPRQPSVIQIFDRDPASLVAELEGTADYRSRIGIRVRGAFSSTWDPQPYSLETWKPDSDDDGDLELLGLPSDSDWILYYLHPDYDLTLLYNTFIWELSRGTGRYGPAFRFVEVFLNDDGGELQLSDRLGTYALVEKVKRGPQRIDFEALSNDGTAGGWLLGLNRMDPEPSSGFPTENGATSPQFFHTRGPNGIAETEPNEAGGGDDIPRQYNAYLNFEHPNGYKINAAQRGAIEQWFVDFEAVLYDDAIWLDPEIGYRRYLNTRDFIDYFHLLNLGKQGDGLLLSVYPWVSSGDRKLHMGPLWDFNNGAYESSPTNPLLFRSDRLWYPRLFDDPAFRSEFVARWHELRAGPLADARMNAIIDAQAAEITDGLAEAQGLPFSTWTQRIASMKAYLSARAAYLDSNYVP